MLVLKYQLKIIFSAVISNNNFMLENKLILDVAKNSVLQAYK